MKSTAKRLVQGICLAFGLILIVLGVLLSGLELSRQPSSLPTWSTQESSSGEHLYDHANLVGVGMIAIGAGVAGFSLLLTPRFRRNSGP